MMLSRGLQSCSANIMRDIKAEKIKEKNLEHFKNLDIFEQAFTVMHSWEQAFEVDPNSDFVFASFWSIEPWMVCSIWMVWEWWIF